MKRWTRFRTRRYACESSTKLGDSHFAGAFCCGNREEQRPLPRRGAVQSAANKLVGRHPHVYADTTATTSAEVIENWNRIKQDERASAGATSALDGSRGRCRRSLGLRIWFAVRARPGWIGTTFTTSWRRCARRWTRSRAPSPTRHGRAAGELGDMLLAWRIAPRFIEHKTWRRRYARM